MVTFWNCNNRHNLKDQCEGVCEIFALLFQAWRRNYGEKSKMQTPYLEPVFSLFILASNMAVQNGGLHGRWPTVSVDIRGSF